MASPPPPSTPGRVLSIRRDKTRGDERVISTLTPCYFARSFPVLAYTFCGFFLFLFLFLFFFFGKSIEESRSIKGSVACPAVPRISQVFRRDSLEGGRVDGQKLMIGIDQEWRRGGQDGRVRKS